MLKILNLLYSYSGYGVEFDSCSLFFIEFPFDFRKNVTIFGVYMGLSAHINNKNKDILVLGNNQHKD